MLHFTHRSKRLEAHLLCIFKKTFFGVFTKAMGTLQKTGTKLRVDYKRSDVNHCSPRLQPPCCPL